MVSFSEFSEYDGLGLAQLVEQGQVTPGELVEAAIERITRLNPLLNAVSREMYEAARAAGGQPLAAGPFRGVPFLLKDAIATCAGVPTGEGTALLQTLPRAQDDEIVRRFRAAGLLIVGKTNVPEFCLMPVTEPAALGPARNPWDPTRTPGGSSGGAAAAVAARMVPLAHGTDGAGSIRMPAACCGLFGLKPSRGRTPTGPVEGELWRGFAESHVITRSVRDSAAMLDVLAGPDVGAFYTAPAPAHPFQEEVGRPPGRLRVALATAPFLAESVDPDCVRAAEDAASLLETLGHEIVEAAPTLSGEAFANAFVTVIAAEARADIEETAARAGRRPSFADFEAQTYTLGLLGKGTSAAAYLAAVRTLQRSARQIAHFFEAYDLLLTPTLAQPPLPIGAMQPTAGEQLLLTLLGRTNASWLLGAPGVNALAQRLAGKIFTFMPYTPLFNVTGQPAMSMPLYWNEAGLPIGVHFAARYGEEALLFRLAAQLEEARPWAERRPPLLRG